MTKSIEHSLTKTSIVLADDHDVVRRGLCALLEDGTDWRVVGMAGDGLEALRLVERLKPDVLVVDLLMPGLNGLEVTRQVSKQWSKTRVVVLSMYSSEGYVLQAMKNGAAAYVLKGSTAEDLLQAIREVKAGRRFLSPPLSMRAIEAYLERARAASSDRYEMLTSRERQILQLLAEGSSNQESAKRLFLSTRTVETHRGHLMRKLGLRNHSQLIRYAIERGIVPEPSDPSTNTLLDWGIGDGRSGKESPTRPDRDAS